MIVCGIGTHAGRPPIVIRLSFYTGDGFYVIAGGEADVVRDGCLLRTRRSGDAFGELDGRDFVSVISGYCSSSREADALTLERLKS